MRYFKFIKYYIRCELHSDGLECKMQNAQFKQVAQTCRNDRDLCPIEFS